jgi:hypothetical protein
MNQVTFASILLLSIGSSSCAYLNPNYHNVVRGPRSTTVRVASDSAEIRRLISEAETRDAQWEPLSRPSVDREGRKRFDTEYMPERRRLLDSMDQAPGFYVSGGSYCRILEKSRAQCEPQATFYSSTYVKVRISTGTARAKEGWVCEGRVPIAGAMP